MIKDTVEWFSTAVPHCSSNTKYLVVEVCTGLHQLLLLFSKLREKHGDSQGSSAVYSLYYTELCPPVYVPVHCNGDAFTYQSKPWLVLNGGAFTYQCIFNCDSVFLSCCFF